MNINLQLLSKSQSKAKQPVAQSALKTPSGSSHGLSDEAMPAPVYGTAFSGQKQRATGATPELEAILKELESFATYDHEQGGFVATRQRCYKNPVGSALGYDTGNGYTKISIKTRLRIEYKVHRLVWLWFTGSWPKIHIDHINQNSFDNRIENLRDVSRSINLRNTKMFNTNTSGSSGISWNKRLSKWESYLTLEDRKMHIGFFPRKEDAIAARIRIINAHPEWGFTELHCVPQLTTTTERHTPTLKITLTTSPKTNP